MFKSLNPDGVAAPRRNYVHSMEVPPNCRWLSLSGQVGVAPDGMVDAEPGMPPAGHLRHDGRIGLVLLEQQIEDLTSARASRRARVDARKCDETCRQPRRRRRSPGRGGGGESKPARQRFGAAIIPGVTSRRSNRDAADPCGTEGVGGRSAGFGWRYDSSDELMEMIKVNGHHATAAVDEH